MTMHSSVWSWFHPAGGGVGESGSRRPGASDTRCDSNLSRIRLDPARNLPGPRTELLLEAEAPLLEVEEGWVALLLSALRQRTRQHRYAGGTCCCSPIPSGAQELRPIMADWHDGGQRPLRCRGSWGRSCHGEDGQGRKQELVGSIRQ